jgi:hypothetical protein
MNGETNTETTTAPEPAPRLRRLRKLSTYVRGQGVLPEALEREDELRAMHVIIGTILSLSSDARPRLLEYVIDASGYEATGLRPKRTRNGGDRTQDQPPKPEPPEQRDVLDAYFPARRGRGIGLLGRIRNGITGRV